MSTPSDASPVLLPVRTFRDGPSHATRTGVPLVLLHAFPFDARMWDDVGAAVPAGRHVLALDLPGHGQARGVTPDEPSLEASADAVASTLAELGIGAAVVAGLSMGGYVALALLERHPGLVAGLALLDTRSTPDTDQARANRLRVADAADATGTVDEVRPMARAVLGPTTLASRTEVVDRVAAWVDEQPPPGVAWTQRAMAARPDRTEPLAAFDGPALVLVGAEDAVTTVADAEHMSVALRDARLVVVPHAGHLSAVETPAVVADELEALARRVDAARADLPPDDRTP